MLEHSTFPFSGVMKNDLRINKLEVTPIHTYMSVTVSSAPKESRLMTTHFNVTPQIY